MGELHHKGSWVPKNWCFWTVVLKTKSPLDCKELQPVHPKGDQSWIFIGRIDAEAETSILWPPDSFEKTLPAGKDWRQEEKGTIEDEMVGWHHWLDGHEFEQAPWVGDGQGGLACAVHGVTKSRTWQSDWTELIYLWSHLTLLLLLLIYNLGNWVSKKLVNWVSVVTWIKDLEIKPRFSWNDLPIVNSASFFYRYNLN